jgi:hypothetical protein
MNYALSKKKNFFFIIFISNEVIMTYIKKFVIIKFIYDIYKKINHFYYTRRIFYL